MREIRPCRFHMFICQFPKQLKVSHFPTAEPTGYRSVVYPWRWNRRQAILGYICEQSWREQCRMTACITINWTKWCWSRMYTKLVITIKTFLRSLCLLSEQLTLVTCKQRADNFTSMMWFGFVRRWFHFIRGRFHYSDRTKYNQNDMTQNSIFSDTHN